MGVDGKPDYSKGVNMYVIYERYDSCDHDEYEAIGYVDDKDKADAITASLKESNKNKYFDYEYWEVVQLRDANHALEIVRSI